MAEGLAPAGMILFHGAGGDREHHTFLAIESSLQNEHFKVARVNFPYRNKGPGRRPPDRMPVLLEAARNEIDKACQHWAIKPEQLILAGRSMGGRVASMLVADTVVAAGLVLLSYPLHPPGKPDKLRVEHFPKICCPILLIQGERDPFGTPEEFNQHLKSIPANLKAHWIDANHNPKPAQDELIINHISHWLDEQGR